MEKLRKKLQKRNLCVGDSNTVYSCSGPLEITIWLKIKIRLKCKRFSRLWSVLLCHVAFTAQRRPVAVHAARSICHCIFLCVGHPCGLCKNGWTDCEPAWWADFHGPKEPRIGGVNVDTSWQIRFTIRARQRCVLMPNYFDSLFHFTVAVLLLHPSVRLTGFYLSEWRCSCCVFCPALLKTMTIRKLFKIASVYWNLRNISAIG